MMSVSNGWAKVREAGGEGEDAVRYVVFFYLYGRYLDRAFLLSPVDSELTKLSEEKLCGNSRLKHKPLKKGFGRPLAKA